MKIFAITYISIVSLAVFSNAQVAKNPDLPVFQYRLTEKPEGDRIQICNLNKGFCETNCGGPNKAPMNFCNPITMGWNCGCIDKVPDLVGYQWPINREHCIGSGEACKLACGDPKIPTESKPKCNQACVEEFTSKCGTPAQPLAYYNVPEVNAVPTYDAPPPADSAKNPPGGAPTDSSGKTGSTGSGSEKQNSASSLSLGNAATALVIVASGMSLLIN